MNTNSNFKAHIICCSKAKDGNLFYMFRNLDSGREGQVPCWCLDDFVIFDSELLDDSGHLKGGIEVWLREMDGGKIYPGTMYKRRDLFCRMSKESLYEKTKLFKTSEPDLNELWRMFSENCENFSKDILIEGAKVREFDVEHQRQFLLEKLKVERMTLPIQESETVECKASFIHPATSAKINTRMVQYRILFAELAAFANSHQSGTLFIGINNQGVIQGVERELLTEVPFNSLADFQADFINQLNIATKNYSFSSSLNIVWYRTIDNHVFCKIEVPEWNDDLILLYGTELYVRDHASKRQLKNDDLIKFIVKHYSTSA